MDYCLTNQTAPALVPSATKPQRSRSFCRRSGLNFANRRLRPLTVIAAAGASHCEFGNLNSPLVPRSPAGRELRGVLLNHPQLFHLAVADELKQLADDRDDAASRMVLSVGSPEASLHRFAFSFTLYFSFLFFFFC